MKKLFALLMALFLCTPGISSQADIRPSATQTPLPDYVLRDSADEIKVFAAMSMKANIVGYILPGGQQEVHVLETKGDWCYVGFTSVYGMSYGYVPLSCFETPALPTPTPLPDVIYAAGTEAWILNSKEGYRLNLRAEPSATAKSLGKYYTGTPVTLTGQTLNGFVQVLLSGTTLGWLDTRFITTDAANFVPELPVITIKNRGSGANLRSGPSTSYNRIGWYKHGTQLTLLGVRADGWCHVTVDGITGYMSESLLSGAYPFSYGTDSDDPLLYGNLADGQTLMYINARSAGGQIHLRKEASTSSKSLGLFFTGTPVTLVSHTRTGWAYVRIGGTEGYMAADYLTQLKPLQTGERRIIRNKQADGLNLRSLPSTGGEVLAYLTNYSTVTVLGDLSDGWCYVLAGEEYGYMLGTGLEKDQ